MIHCVLSDRVRNRLNMRVTALGAVGRLEQ